MSTAPVTRYTPAQYIDRERNALTKSEYFAGKIFAMTGGTEPHNLIAVNAGAELRQQLKQRPCKVYLSDMRVRVSATGLYTYPDVVVVCGEAEFEDEHRDTLLNPTVLVEVLSPSTEAYNRGKRFGHYRIIPSLKEYVLISQDRHLVEVFTRQPDGHWLLAEASRLDETIPLGSIQATLRLVEVYEKVELAPETEVDNGVAR
jgi:Uma2 family endonuclease